LDDDVGGRGGTEITEGICCCIDCMDHESAWLTFGYLLFCADAVALLPAVEGTPAAPGEKGSAAVTIGDGAGAVVVVVIVFGGDIK